MSKALAVLTLAVLPLVVAGCNQPRGSGDPTPADRPTPAPQPTGEGPPDSGGQSSSQSGKPEQLLRNPGFEAVPQEVIKDQGYLPSEWLQCGNISPGADTYSNDGSWGLPPNSLGNFTDLAAREGGRFAAAGYAGGKVHECIGQKLTRPLRAEETYTFTASLLEGPRIRMHGTYELVLSPKAAFDAPGAVSLGRLELTTATGQWEERRLTFRAPAGADQLPYFILVPHSADGASWAYLGIDRLSLTAGQ